MIDTIDTASVWCKN